MSHLLSGDKPGNSSGVEELETSWNQDGSFPVNRNKNNSHVTNLKTTPGGASKEPVELKRSNPLKVTRPGGTINEERPPNRTTVNRLKQLAENNAMNANGVTLNPHMVERAQDNHAVKNSGCNSGQCESETTQQPKRNTRVRADIAQDCSDYTFGKPKRSGIFKVRPDLRNSPFLVFCDMDSYGGGWTLLQHRYDGSISFNRSWNDYKMGFGHLKGEFWLGNDKIHLLTKTEDMLLRIELEDIDGLKAHATYEHFFVASEQQLYRLSVGTYFGTAGNAMSFSDKFNHDQKYFSTPDRDNDMYASGNCGDYYSSGWWFDSCMAANLNGKYYKTQYKGVRNGIFWGTWPNISWEYYPTNYRQAFKTVKMMIRPKDYTL
ncbi:fibroleukin [Denticeps clupeoides]|uniref:fibroleukin n=1 Tax=Denticeps clupeoides TaxID=299321 RepID=UPI0010A4BAAE|nr:fibroleukin-like [Denticeps clupeoides]